jgi:hypothetical protein
LRFLALWAAKHAFLSGSSLKTEVFRDALYAIHNADICRGVHPVAVMTAPVLNPACFIPRIARFRPSRAPAPMEALSKTKTASEDEKRKG